MVEDITIEHNPAFRGEKNFISSMKVLKNTLQNLKVVNEKKIEEHLKLDQEVKSEMPKAKKENNVIKIIKKEWIKELE